jgi:hypothetical protein
MSIHKLQSIQDEVKELLTFGAKYRDDDALLVAAYYYKKRGSALHTMSAVDFLQLLVNGSLPFPDSITRVRRKLQEKYKDLRGSNYAIRQHLETEVRRDINAL